MKKPAFLKKLRDYRQIAKEAGVTPDQAERMLAICDEMSEEDQEAMGEFLEKITKWAEDDGVSITEMVNALRRRKS